MFCCFKVSVLSCLDHFGRWSFFITRNTVGRQRLTHFVCAHNFRNVSIFGVSIFGMPISDEILSQFFYFFQNFEKMCQSLAIHCSVLYIISSKQSWHVLTCWANCNHQAGPKSHTGLDCFILKYKGLKFSSAYFTNSNNNLNHKYLVWCHFNSAFAFECQTFYRDLILQER